MARTLYEEVFPLWLALNGVKAKWFKPGQAAKENGFSGSLSEWSATSAAARLHNAFLLGDEELTGQLMLEEALRTWTQERTLSWAKLLDQPEKVNDTLEGLRTIRAALTTPERLARKQAFQEHLHALMAHYAAADKPAARALLENPTALAELRVKAFTALGELRVSQFLRGPIEETAAKPRYSTVIRRWTQLDHLLAAHASMPEGVSLNLMRAPGTYDSFFCFVVRRGANLYIIDDAPGFTHPLEASRSRRAARRAGERAEQFLFPYELIEAEITPAPGTALSLPGQGEVSQVVATLADLDVECLVWVGLVFEDILDKFWNQPPPQLEIQHTSAEVRQQPLWLEVAREAQLPVLATPSLALPALTRSDVETMHQHPQAGAFLGETAPLGMRASLLARHSAQVPVQAWDVAPRALALTAPEEPARGLQRARQPLARGATLPEGKMSVAARASALPPVVLDVQRLDPTLVASAQEMEADRNFLARYNHARAISVCVEQEFEARRAEIAQWLEQAYAERVPFLLSLAAAAAVEPSGLTVLDWEAHENPHYVEFNALLGVQGWYHRPIGPCSQEERAKQAPRPVSHTLAAVRPWPGSWGWGVGAYVPSPSEDTRRFKPRCHLTSGPASFLLGVAPTNADELAWLLGKSVSDLPDELQDWCIVEPTYGNSILDRIDPMLWAVENPWVKLRLGACLGLSKRGLKQAIAQAPPAVDVSALEKCNLRRFLAGAPAVPAERPPRRRR